jgi:hypothetical protein
VPFEPDVSNTYMIGNGPKGKKRFVISSVVESRQVVAILRAAGITHHFVVKPSLVPA